MCLAVRVDWEVVPREADAGCMRHSLLSAGLSIAAAHQRMAFTVHIHPFDIRWLGATIAALGLTPGRTYDVHGCQHRPLVLVS
jgi:hypothetical protein